MLKGREKGVKICISMLLFFLEGEWVSPIFSGISVGREVDFGLRFEIGCIMKTEIMV